MKATTCLVSDADYQRYWRGKPMCESCSTTDWSGEERRVSADRRSGAHERRWEQSRGRRFRLTDRRKAR